MKHFLSEIFQVNDWLSFQTTYQLVEIIIALFPPTPSIYWINWGIEIKDSRDLV